MNFKGHQQIRGERGLLTNSIEPGTVAICCNVQYKVYLYSKREILGTKNKIMLRLAQSYTRSEEQIYIQHAYLKKQT